jgi:transposase
LGPPFGLDPFRGYTSRYTAYLLVRQARDAQSSEKLLKLPDVKESIPVPTIQPYIIEPIWEQFVALLPERKVNHPLGCHRARIPDRVVFEKLLQILVFGCAYWRIADKSCSATTLRRRRDKWIEAGLMDALEVMALEAYDRTISLKLSDISVDCCITESPCGGEKAGRSPVDRGKRGHQTLDNGRCGGHSSRSALRSSKPP